MAGDRGRSDFDWRLTFGVSTVEKTNRLVCVSGKVNGIFDDVTGKY